MLRGGCTRTLSQPSTVSFTPPMVAATDKLRLGSVPIPEVWCGQHAHRPGATAARARSVCPGVRESGG